MSEKLENEIQGPGFYSVTHQSAEINGTSLSKKGTAYFPSLVPCTTCKKISNYPAANAYKILSCFQPKQDFSKENPSMFQHPIARSIEKIPTPAHNQCYVSRFAREDKDGGGSQLMYNVCEVMFDVPEDTRTSCNLPGLGAALRVAATAQTFAPDLYGFLQAKQLRFWPDSVYVPNHKRIKFGKIWKTAFSMYKSLELGGKTLLVILVLIIQGHYDINDSLIKVSPKGITSCFKSKTSRLTRMQEFCLTLSAPAIPPCKDPPSPGPRQYNPVDYKGSPKQDCSRQTAFVSNTGQWTECG
ncbi:PREDICTED: O(6)-methylguanine-induced apoptosis 2 [Haliaeetus leucocephalus]|uniref:O(6)-methylguanine-induced apoptosis 2 n=1 Tax=Haliaeetus leucocephalus TaxID=52644 RepID=UPI00053CB011|nr:PREDICTED: O(6)-methylguanine-induced apoptosis 2 [Haliaeetus leucocephalus]